MMVPVPVLAIAGAVMLLLVWKLVRRGSGRDLIAPPAMPEPRVSPQDLPPGLEGEVRALIAERRKIEAIKRVREATGLGLKEAKELVEAIEAGASPV